MHTTEYKHTSVSPIHHFISAFTVECTKNIYIYIKNHKQIINRFYSHPKENQMLYKSICLCLNHYLNTRHARSGNKLSLNQKYQPWYNNSLTGLFVWIVCFWFSIIGLKETATKQTKQQKHLLCSISFEKNNTDIICLIFHMWSHKWNYIWYSLLHVCLCLALDKM